MKNSAPRLVSLSIVVTALLAGCERKPPAASPAGSLVGHNVLLVTLDTTRADHLGCYGYAQGTTPTLDALAARGTLFRHAYAQAPTTLPSHCTIFTGLYPREHGVRNNGRDALAPDGATLATVFKEHGYRTAAFVGSYVLDPRFGLNRGFDTYDAEMGALPRGGNQIEAERPADVVTDRALRWLGSGDKTPFFCWIHYYDPHDPYTPPPAFQQRFAEPYDGEIAFMDSQFQRIIDWLTTADLASKTLIVIVGDHGESLGEHGEHGHAIFLYDTTLHVPMILVSPGAIPAGKQVATDVELGDVFSTVLDLMGWSVPAGISSRSLVLALTDKLASRDCFAESLYALDAYGWAEQRCVITPKWKYVSSTQPELFDRHADAPEAKNRAEERPDVAKNLGEVLMKHYETIRPGQARQVELNASGRRSLESLGYIAGGHAQQTEQFLTPGLPDPKHMLDVVADLLTARRLLRDGRTAEAIPLLKRAAERSPASRLIHYDLGVGLLQVGQVDAAIAALDAALRIDPRYAEALVALGDATLVLRQFDRAVEYFRGALALNDQIAEAQLGLARALQATGHLDESVVAYRKALALAPGNADAESECGDVLLRLQQVPEAIGHLREAVRLNPDLGTALNHLGIALAQQGQLAEARDVFRKAAQLSKSAAEAYYNLGVTAGNEGNAAEALAHYERSFELNPAAALTVEALVSSYLNQHRASDALRVLRNALTASPNDPRLANSLAWLLATVPDDKLRDGPRALALARRVVEITKSQSPTALRTLAAAYAETGDFAQATLAAQRALELATTCDEPELAEALRVQLQHYQVGRPFRASEERLGVR